MWKTGADWWATQIWTVPQPPRCIPWPPESIKCDETGISIGNSFSISSTSGARPNGHQEKCAAFIPGAHVRPPWPSVLSA